MNALGPAGCEILEVRPETWTRQFEQEIMKIEQVFPVSLRDTAAYLKWISELEDSVFLVAKMNDSIVGYVAGAGLEQFGDIPGTKQDPHFGVGDTVYLESFAVLGDYQGKGIGRQLIKAFLLRTKKKNFRFVSGHMHEGFAQRWRGISLQQFQDYYQTGQVFEYFRRELEFGTWAEGCKNMITVQAILAGFAGVVLASLLTISLPTTGGLAVLITIVAMLTIITAIGSLIYSVEKSTDALDQYDPNIYTDALVPYNLGVVLFLAGIALTFATYLTKLWSEGDLGSLYPVLLTAVVVVLAFSSAHWVEDFAWLLNKKNRRSYPASLEFEEE